MNETSLKSILEAVLMSSTEPLTIDTLLTVFEAWEKPTRAEVQRALLLLKADYEPRSVELVLLASGYCFQTKPSYANWVSRLFAEKPTKYSHALFEILSIIAYKQPVTRAEIEEIRGVTVSSSILKTLLDREWIQTAGYREVLGKPALYVTTATFLDDFNMVSLDDLPVVDKVNDGG